MLPRGRAEMVAAENDSRRSEPSPLCYLKNTEFEVLRAHPCVATEMVHLVRCGFEKEI
jgi:hypothetical protein